MNNKNNKSNAYAKTLKEVTTMLKTLPSEMFFKNLVTDEQLADKIQVNYLNFKKHIYAKERNIEDTPIAINYYSFGGIQINAVLFLASQENPEFLLDGDFEKCALLIKLNANNYFDLINNIVRQAISDPAFSFEYEDAEDNYPTLSVLYNGRCEIKLMDDCQINNIKTNYIASAIQKLPEEMQCYLALQGVVL